MADMTFRIEAASSRVAIARLNALPAEWGVAWDQLAANASEPNPFAERWFMQPSVAHLAPPRDARMIAVWHGDALIGLLPVGIVQRYGRIPARHVQNWLHYHSFLGTPLVLAGVEHAFWEAALTTLDNADWARGFLHLTGLAEGPVLRALCDTRRTDIVYRAERATLASDLTPAAYYEANNRKKKRKEIGRLSTRLAELGAVRFERLAERDSIEAWTDAFLALEASGWKGTEGSALDTDAATRAFFREAVWGAFAAGRLEMLRLDLDGRPIAMLVNFMTPPGSFSFKIAFDETFARFSPGVLIQIENLRILDNPAIGWMDSCAVEDHSMINSLWAERRKIVRVTVPLKGARRRTVFEVCRGLEKASAMARQWR